MDALALRNRNTSSFELSEDLPGMTITSYGSATDKGNTVYYVNKRVVTEQGYRLAEAQYRQLHGMSKKNWARDKMMLGLKSK